MPDSIQFPDSANRALDKYFGVNDLQKKSNSTGFSVSLDKLWSQLTLKNWNKSSNKSEHYGYSKELVRVYGLYYLSSNFLKINSILSELSSQTISFEWPRDIRWLDLGCGPGTVFWGLSTFFNDQTKINYLGVDQSSNFLKLANEISMSLKSELVNGPETQLNFLCEEISEKNRKLLKDIEDFNPNWISIMNAIHEIGSSIEHQKNFIDTLIKVLEKKQISDGMPRWVLIVEPGAHEESRNLLEIRELIRSYPQVQILLPCLDNRVCGARNSLKDWCHEEVHCEFPPWFNNLGEKSELIKSSLLFSYILFSVGGGKQRNHKELSNGVRVVSQRMSSKGLIECFVCTSVGKKRARLICSKESNETRFFNEIKRGDIFKNFTTDEKGSIKSKEDF